MYGTYRCSSYSRHCLIWPCWMGFASLYRLAQRAGGVTEANDHIAQAFRPVLPQMLSTLSSKANQAPDVSHLPLILSFASYGASHVPAKPIGYSATWYTPSCSRMASPQGFSFPTGLPSSLHVS